MSTSAPHLVAVEPEDTGGSGVLDVIRRRFSGTYELDPWGLDVDATRWAGRLASLRWSVMVEGIERIPADGPALLVANRRLGWSEPIVVASALLERTGRVIRPVGGLDIDPAGALMRRLGALPARPGEIAAALRAGNLVLVPTRREPVRNRPGHLPIELLAPAVAAGVPIIPVAVIGWEFSRHWTVRVGAPVQTVPTTKRRSNKHAPPAAGEGVDPREVGQAAVDVSVALDELLADVHRKDPIQRILSLVPHSHHQEPSGRWEGS